MITREQIDEVFAELSDVRWDEQRIAWHAQKTQLGHWWRPKPRRKRTKTCKAGHEWTARNTYLKGNGQRACKECRKRWKREAYWRKKQGLRG